MTDKERIELLEKQVSELNERLNSSKVTRPWTTISDDIENRIIKMFGKMCPQAAGFKSSITSIVGKSFNKNSVLNLSEEQVEKAKELTDFILNFAETNRSRGDENRNI